jgi:ATP-dependent helicase/nuclease subunit A
MSDAQNAPRNTSPHSGQDGAQDGVPNLPLEKSYEIDGQRAEPGDFYAVACNPAQPVVVEACAGAGKTWMLVSRMLRALLAQAAQGGELRPDEILAITFTKDAAAEMRERLHQWLHEFALADESSLRQELLARGFTPDELNKNANDPAQNIVILLSNLYQNVLQCGREVQVHTFHGWFAALLKVAPLSVLEHLQLPANYELVEDDGQIVGQVWRRFYAALLQGGVDAQQLKADYQAVVHEHGASNTQKALRSALDKRVEFARADAAGVPAHSVKRFAEVFTEFAGLDEPEEFLSTNRDHRQKLREAARVLIDQGSPTQRDKGEELARALDEQNIANMLAALLTKEGTARQFGKLKTDERIQSAQELVLRVAKAQHQHAAWQHQQRMTRLSRALLREYAALKQEQGWVDMSDLERAAVALLSSPVLSGWVQERLDLRVRHLLIDEFQDTNPLQWQALFAWLQSYAGAGSRAPSLFIVGDPKQSIYRFRRAEPQVFEAAKEFVRDGLGGHVLACDHTRRNASAVLGLVNAVMQAAQDADELGLGAHGEPVFRPHSTDSQAIGRCVLLPRIPREAKDKRVVSLDWRDSLLTPRDLAQEQYSEREAKQAAAYLAQAIAQAHIQPGDVMVLARKRKRLVAMHEALRAQGIASHYLEKTSLMDAPEVRDLAALIEALVSPGNNLALAQALKSPLFGASDELLGSVARAARAQGCSWSHCLFHLLQKTELIDENLRGVVVNFIEPVAASLRQYQHWLNTLPPHDALDAIYHHADVMARMSAAAPAPLRASVQANLQALLASSLAVDGGRFLSPYAWLRQLHSGSLAAQSVANPLAVQLLTVHGAKGLEAPWVLLLDTDAQPAKAEHQTCLLDWPAEQSAPRRFVFLPSETQPPACCSALMQQETAARAREDINALYVAMTRARQQLIISAHEPHQSAPNSTYQRVQTALMTGAAAVQTVAVESANAASPAHSPHQLENAVLVNKMPIAAVNTTFYATKNIVNGKPEDTAQSRIGQAMHRLLERVSTQELQQRNLSEASCQAVQREFQLSPAQSQQAKHMAQTILNGQAAWAWDQRLIAWAGNEVELVAGGQLLRIDRVVQRKDTLEWWVLDYKSSHSPQQQSELREQLARYAEAFSQAQGLPAPARAAFATAQGECVVL